MTKTIFVFGSNLQGIHGAGAAKHARMFYGAELGVGEGRTGNAYALPTKSTPYSSRSYDEVYESVKKFNDYVFQCEEEVIFIVTPVGCGLAGFPASDIAKMFKQLPWPDHVYLHPSWWEHV